MEDPKMRYKNVLSEHKEPLSNAVETHLRGARWIDG